MHEKMVKLDEIWTCSFSGMLGDRQTNKQAYRLQYYELLLGAK